MHCGSTICMRGYKHVHGGGGGGSTICMRGYKRVQMYARGVTNMCKEGGSNYMHAGLQTCEGVQEYA